MSIYAWSAVACCTALVLQMEFLGGFTFRSVKSARWLGKELNELRTYSIMPLNLAILYCELVKIRPRCAQDGSPKRCSMLKRSNRETQNKPMPPSRIHNGVTRIE